MGIIVNLTDRTVQGFPAPFNYPLKVGYVNDVEVRFGGEDEGLVRSIIVGSIDRVTGDVEATESLIVNKPIPEPHKTYELKCKPTQRMF
jgi:hypothetical protein